MSFDIFMQAFRDGEATTIDASAARAVLSGVNHNHNSEFDAYVMEFADGSYLEMYAGGVDGKKPFDGAMFALRNFNNTICNFIFEFTRAAGCVLFPASNVSCVLLTDESQSQHLPADLSNDFQIILISSAAELLAAIEGGYDAWRAYRDRVVGSSSLEGGT